MRLGSSLLAVAVVVLLAGPARSAGPVCALLDPEKDSRVALLEAKLLAEPDTTWVERAAIEKVLAEQKLQALFGAGGVGDRVKLGKLLKADVLVLVRRAKDTREPALELVVSETSGGLRLLIRGAPVTADPDADVAALLAAARDGIKRHAVKVTEVVAVPPFVSRDLSTEHDHLKAALARVAEQAAQARPGTLAVELEEARALAKELATAAPGTAVTRPLPLYLLGEFRHTGMGADQTVSLRLRAERGGKPVGKSEERSVKTDEAAGVVRAWAVAVLPANGTPVAQPDAKADADQLAARAREFARIGGWAESLDLCEAALLVAPDQMSLRADALFSLSRVLAGTWDRSGLVPRTDRSVTLFRRGLQHLETLAVQGGGIAAYENRRNILSEFRGSVRSLYLNDTYPLKTREFIHALRKEEREVLFRLLPALIKRNRGEDLRFVGEVVSSLSVKDQYEYLEAIILHTQELPGARDRAFRYTQRWNFDFRFLDSPHLRDYLDRLDKAGNAEVKAAVAEMRKKIPAVSPWSRKTPDPNQPKPLLWDDGSWDPPSRVALRPLTFTIVGREIKDKRQPPVRPVGLLAAGRQVDVAWNEEELFLMREPGKLEPVSLPAGGRVYVRSSVFDGRFVWLAGHFGSSTLVVLDPASGKVRDVSAAEGLPKPGARGQTLVLAPLAPGRVAIAGGFGRAWVGILTFDATAGKASVRVIHEARELQETSAKDQSGRATVGFTPRFLFVLRNANDTGPARVLVGRGAPGHPEEGSMNPEVVAHPLVVDTETGDAKVLGDRMWGGYLPPAYATHDGSVSFLDSELHTARLQLSRVTAPGRKIVVAPDVPIPVNDRVLLLFHDGRIHIVREDVGSRTVRHGSDWWIADPDGRRIRMIGSDLPRVTSIATSAHYGIVAWTSHIEPRQEIRVNAVEFVNLPPADPAREPPVGLTPEDPERSSAKLTPVKLDADPATGQPPKLFGLTAAGAGIDVAWTYNTLYLMTEKGKLRQVWTTEELNTVFTDVRYDGRYVWAAARRSRKSPLLLVLDPKTEKVTAVEGLPEPPEPPGKFDVQFQWLLLTTLGPGRACAVGWSDHTWVARASFDAEAGKATAKVVHTAADQPDRANEQQWFSPTVSFTPTFLVAIRGEPRADGVTPWRVLIGRGEPLWKRGTYNSRVTLHPLLVDPDSGAAEVPDYTVTQRQQAEYAALGGAVLFVEHNKTRKGTFQLRRIGFPGTDKETTTPRVSEGAVVAHDGRVRIVTNLWWFRDRDGKVERKPPAQAHWFRGFAPSSHYGLAVVAELGGPASLCAVEFADPPP